MQEPASTGEASLGVLHSTPLQAGRCVVHTPHAVSLMWQLFSFCSAIAAHKKDCIDLELRTFTNISLVAGLVLTFIEGRCGVVAVGAPAADQ